MGFPAIPGAPKPDGALNPFVDYDFGPGFIAKDLSGVFGKLPPAARGTLPSLVPKVDADGNEIAGAPSVQRLVPLGTYLGWNVTADGFYKGQGCGFSGGYIPFARTKAERLASGDPRRVSGGTLRHARRLRREGARRRRRNWSANGCL